LRTNIYGTEVAATTAQALVGNGKRRQASSDSTPRDLLHLSIMSSFTDAMMDISRHEQQRPMQSAHSDKTIALDGMKLPWGADRKGCGALLMCVFPESIIA
jgi:hypothetical protein